MNYYKLFKLGWLLPAFFLFLTLQQAKVYYGITDTYENGTSYTAEVTDFQFKQIASQTSGYIVVLFNTKDGKRIQQKNSIPVEMASKLREIRVIPIRYQPDSWQEIVFIPTLDIQKDLIWTNILMALLGLIATFFIALATHRYANKKSSGEEQGFVIERVD